MTFEIKTERDVRRIFEDMMKSLINDTIRETQSGIRLGIVSTVNTEANTVTVQVLNTGETVGNIKYQKGASGILEGDPCIVLSEDPTNKGRLYAVVF